MPSRYHPIEDGLWSDEKFDAHGDLPEATGDERGFYAFLATNPYQRLPGLYRASDQELAAAYHWPVRRVTVCLATLHRRGLIVRDGLWIFFPGYLKRQAHNPSVLKSSRWNLDLCNSKAVLLSFIQHYPLYSSWCSHRVETVETPVIKSVLQSSYRAEQLQSRAEQNTTPSSSSPHAATTGRPWPSPESLAAKYNTETPDNVPAVDTIKGKRREKCLAYLRLFPDEAWWTATFRQYHRSRFLSGKTEPTNGHKTFKPDFDWLLSVGKDGTENCVKVHDGRYCDGP